MQVSETDTLHADDCEFLLRSRFDDNFCHVHDNADGVYATKIIIWRCVEQPGSKHLFLRWWHCWGAIDCLDWQWLAIYHPRSLGAFQRNRDLGYETVWAAMARKDGSRARIIIAQRKLDKIGSVLIHVGSR